MKNRFKRKRLFLRKKIGVRFIGYARAIETEVDYLNEQIESLKEERCNMVFSEIISANIHNKPQLRKAIQNLSSGDQLILTSLDRAFYSKDECIKTIHDLLVKGIHIRTLSGLDTVNSTHEPIISILNMLFELNQLEKDHLREKRKEINFNRTIVGGNVGGRPRVSPLKESLVRRLREEGCSYRTIRSQTGIALSTIRRIIVDSQS